MKIAFLCLAHSDPEYLERLIEYCNADGDDIYVHIDKRSDIDRHKLERAGAFVVSKDESYVTRWGSFALVDATVMLMRLAFSKEYDHYMLISGSDLPIMTKSAMKARLAEREVWMMCWHRLVKYDADCDRVKNNQVFKRHYCDNVLFNRRTRFSKNNYVNRICERAIGILARVVRLFSIPDAWEVYDSYFHGSQFWSLNHAAVGHVLGEFEKNSRRYRRRFRLMLAPDELMIQTIIKHSRFAADVIGPKPYPAAEDATHYNDRFRLRDRGYPYLTASDIPKLGRASVFFARKVHREESQQVVERLFGGE